MQIDFLGCIIFSCEYSGEIYWGFQIKSFSSEYK